MAFDFAFAFGFVSSVASGAAFAGLSAFFFGAAMVDPRQVSDHHITPNGLAEFLHVWLAYLALWALLPGVVVLGLCAAVGCLFAMVINPWRAAVYLGAFLEGTKRLLQACAVAVLHDSDTPDRMP